MTLLSVLRQIVWVSKSRSIILNENSSSPLLEHAQSRIYSPCHLLLPNWSLYQKLLLCRKDVPFSSSAAFWRGYLVIGFQRVPEAELLWGRTNQGEDLQFSSTGAITCQSLLRKRPFPGKNGLEIQPQPAPLEERGSLCFQKAIQEESKTCFLVSWIRVYSGRSIYSDTLSETRNWPRHKIYQFLCPAWRK